MADPQTRFHPIIYVRGYAMTESEQNETAADPFCGFNLGSTVYRATIDKKQPPRKFIFESPLVRLISDYKYSDVYENGLDITDSDWEGPIPARSIITYRYYDQASSLLGNGKTPDIETFAKGLSELVLKVRDLVCAHPDNDVTPKTFRCYLVAHSMGGLVCRAFLQNPALGTAQARQSVDKFFTYATPHNGIDMAGINIPSWMKLNDMNNFNRESMAKYLDLEALYKKTGRVDWMPEEVFSSRKIFCMVGSNRADYEVALGLSRTFAGHGSDGLVRVENASVWGTAKAGKETTPCATAYAYRSHSGNYGIVNCEEAYQNLARFLFGDLRIDIWAEIESVQLPPAIADKKVNALYLFELLASPRGKRWYLSRRLAEEDSVACRTHEQLSGKKAEDHSIYLSTVILSKQARVDPERPSLAYGLTFNVRVPEYEVEKKLWLDGHYEGSALFSDTLIVEITPPDENDIWTGVFSWKSTGRKVKPLTFEPIGSNCLDIAVPFGSSKAPGLSGQLRFKVAGWNN